jgi:hypothetical protein
VYTLGRRLLRDAHVRRGRAAAIADCANATLWQLVAMLAGSLDLSSKYQSWWACST